MTTHQAEKLVLERFLRDRELYSCSYPRYYSVVHPLRNKEARIDVYACSLSSRRKQPLVKCIIRYYSNSRKFDIRDVFFSRMAGYRVDFSDLTRDCIHYYERHYTEESLKKYPVGSWDTEEYQGYRKTMFMLRGGLINTFKGTKYEHSGIEKTCMHFLEFFECYGISHAVEFLAKNDLSYLISPAFVRKLKEKKDFFNFFRMNFKDIRDKSISKNEVNIMFAHKCSINEARDRITASSEFKHVSWHKDIPAEIDRYKLYKYCKKNRIQINAYRRYVDYLTNAGEDIRAYGVTMPSNFSEALEIAETKSHEADEQRRRDAKRAERQRRKDEKAEKIRISEAIADMAKKLATLNGITGYGYAVVVPSSTKMLIDEGNAMKNCIGTHGYDRKIATGQSLIFFLRGMDGKSNVDVEVVIVKDGNRVKLKVMQCYTAGNRNTPEDASRFARELANKAKSILFTKKKRKAA